MLIYPESATYDVTNPNRLATGVPPLADYATTSTPPSSSCHHSLLANVESRNPLSDSTRGTTNYSPNQRIHQALASQLTNHFGNSLWNKTVFQISHSEPAVRNAVISLATCFPQQTHVACKVGRLESRANYLKALQALNRRLDNSSLSWEIALICSLLFAAFEAFDGKDHDAMKHLWAGFAILKEYSSKHAGPTENLRDLTGAFLTFDVQASSFATSYSPKFVHVPHVPPSFANIGEAREVLDGIVTYEHSIFKTSDEAKRILLQSSLPSEIREDVPQITAYLAEWKTTFDRFLTNANPRPSSVAIKILQIQHLRSHIKLSTHVYREQMAYDAFTTEFVQIITLSSSVVETLFMNSDGIIHSFSFEVGIIQPLYFTACRCPNAVLRRKAIVLLQKAGIEGLWDGRATAAAARWVMKLEEESGSGDEDAKNGFIPEAKRLREIGVTVNKAAKRMRLVSSRRDNGGVLSYVAANIGWGESADIEVEDGQGLAAAIKEWKKYI